MFKKSIIFGVLCFAIFLIKDWVFKSEIQWQGTLFGVILATLVFFGF